LTFLERRSANDITIQGAWCHSVADWPRIIRGRYRVERIVTAQLPLDTVVAEGFDRLIHPAGAR
jgi:(R,R)-butanediol dehydrogenase/meso-butanediol dehydrogenase/diacetyl reductase